MPVPSKADVDLKELAVKCWGRLPVWYGVGAEVDVSRGLPGEVFVDSTHLSATRRVAKKVAGGRSPRRPPGRRYYWVGTPEGCQNFRCSDLLR